MTFLIQIVVIFRAGGLPQLAHDDLVQNHHYFMTLFSRVMMKMSLVNTFLVVSSTMDGSMGSFLSETLLVDCVTGTVY
jgi:hypothetical protein